MAEELRAVFDKIAPSWYNYRHHTIFREELEGLAKEWRSGRLLNLGCGHGADFLPFAGYELHGIDFSREMITLAQKYAAKYNIAPRLAVGDITALPYNNETFDYAIGVATYHHLKADSRLPALRELKRVLKPQGYAFITVWNRRQRKFWFKGSEIMVPWRARDTTLYRYYHPFTYGEIEKLARTADFKVEQIFPEKSFRSPLKYFSQNICLVLKKA